MAARRKQPSDPHLADELAAMLESKFPGMGVHVEIHPRWNRPCATFTWPGFADLLPEERFHRLATVIPETFREERLGGHIWLELAPGETVEAFLSLPRSEDIAPREAQLYGDLVQSGFFDALSKAMGPAPGSACRGVFEQTLRVLKERGLSAGQIDDAKLVLIHHGAYCDCQVLLTARSSLDAAHHGAA